MNLINRIAREGDYLVLNSHFRSSTLQEISIANTAADVHKDYIYTSRKRWCIDFNILNKMNLGFKYESKRLVVVIGTVNKLDPLWFLELSFLPQDTFITLNTEDLLNDVVWVIEMYYILFEPNYLFDFDLISVNHPVA
jgi:hypothetical protein